MTATLIVQYPTSGAPVFTPASGSFSGSQVVTITTGPPGSKVATYPSSIRYTTDGSTPTANSALYTGPLTVTATTTIKALVVINGQTQGSVVTATYSTGATNVAFWPLTDGAGAGQFVDHVGTANMTYYATPSFSVISGMGSTAVPFLNNTGGQAAVESAINFNGTQPMSIAFWVNTPAAGAQTIIGDLDVSNGFIGWEVSATASSSFQFAAVAAGGQITSTSPSNTFVTNSTYFVVITYDGSKNASNVLFYVNGSLVSTTVVLNTMTGPATSTIGVRTGSRHDGSVNAFNDVAYVRVYSGVLTQAQVTALNAAGPQ